MGIYTELEEKAIKRFKEAEDSYREYIHKRIHTGNGSIEQLTRGV